VLPPEFAKHAVPLPEHPTQDNRTRTFPLTPGLDTSIDCRATVVRPPAGVTS